MMRLSFLIAALWTTIGVAQQGARPQPVGTVVGHVTCSDTQRPARLAQVKLVRVPTAADLKSGSAETRSTERAQVGNPVETSLDGSYTIHNVKPGLYYLVVYNAGYLVPLSQFSKKDLAATDDETRTRVAKAVRPINVEGGQTVREDVVLERGASVSGTVTYDDGTPASGVAIDLLVKGKDGKWVQRGNERYINSYGPIAVDDYGHYRITGLSPGEYMTEATLALNDHEETFGPMPGHPETMMSLEMTKTRFSLPLYSGDVLRKSEAKSYSLGSGQARTGSDLIFPLAKLHRVGGQVLAKDGHAVNGGSVKLLYVDDRSEMTETAIQYDDQAFHLEFVPEGEFVLKVADAKDLTKVQVANAPGYTPRFHEDSRTVKSYGDAERALLVGGDTNDVLVVVPEMGKAEPSSP